MNIVKSIAAAAALVLVVACAGVPEPTATPAPTATPQPKWERPMNFFLDDIRLTSGEEKTCAEIFLYRPALVEGDTGEERGRYIVKTVADRLSIGFDEAYVVLDACYRIHPGR